MNDIVMNTSNNTINIKSLLSKYVTLLYLIHIKRHNLHTFLINGLGITINPTIYNYYIIRRNS